MFDDLNARLDQEAADRSAQRKLYRERNTATLKAERDARRRTPEWKAYAKAYNATPKAKATAKARREAPDARARKLERDRTPEYKAKRAARYQQNKVEILAASQQKRDAAKNEDLVRLFFGTTD